MKEMCRGFAKGLFGAKYQRLKKNVGIFMVLFLGLYMAEIRLEIASSILYLISMTLTSSIMWQGLSAENCKTNMDNIWMLPFDGKTLIISYIGMLGAYTILTNTCLFWAIAFAISEPSVVEVIGCILAALVAIIITSSFFVFYQIKVLGEFRDSLDIPYVFCVKKTEKTKGKTGRHHGVWKYLFRYLCTHKNYLTNMIIMWCVACLLPMLFGEINPTFILPIGFAILSINTPICILISCDPSLEQAIRFLPGQKSRFLVPYGMFIFLCNLIVDVIFLASWEIQIGGITGKVMGIATLFALLGALGSVILEWFCPLRNWKIESDLWHHPRKYIVPGVLVLLAGILGMC